MNLRRRCCAARSAFVVCFACALLVALPGCAGKGKVSGRVLLNGTPLPGGWLTFRPADARQNSVSVPINPDGTYEAVLPVGEVGISVDNRELEPTKAPPPPKLPQGVKIPPASGGAGASSGTSTSQTAAEKLPGTYVPISENYTLADTSGLSYKVKRGEQTHDIELK
jgi:hypothetical protein